MSHEYTLVSKRMPTDLVIAAGKYAKEGWRLVAVTDREFIVTGYFERERKDDTHEP